MALNNNACLFLAMIVMVSSNALVNGQTLPNNISPTPAPNVAVDEWKVNMINLLNKPIEVQFSIKTFIDAELPKHLDKLNPDIKNAIIDRCIKSTKDTLTLLDSVKRFIHDNETKAKLTETLTQAEDAGKDCLYQLDHFQAKEVPRIPDLVKEYETVLKQAKTSILSVNDEWKVNMINLVNKPIEVQLSIKTFIDAELPKHLDKLNPDLKNTIIDRCIKSTKDTLTLLDSVKRFLHDNETMAKLTETLTQAEDAGQDCLYQLDHFQAKDVPRIPDLVKEYETVLRQAKTSILWEN